MKKKVLIVGSDFWGYNDSVGRAFQKHDFDVRIVGFRDIYGLPNKIRYAINPYKAKSKSNKKYINKLILRIYDEFKPDIFFVIKGTILFESTIKKIKNAVKVLWMMDSIYKYREIYFLKECFDYLFMFEKTDVDKLFKEGINSYFLPLALDESVYYPIENLKKEIDIFFVGSLSDDRLDIFYNIMDNFRTLNLKFFGHRFKTKNKPFKYFFNKNVFPNHTLKPEEVNQYYNRSKICLNILKDQSKYGVNQRFFEIAGTKSFQIVSDNKYITEYFGDDGIYTFNNYGDLICKIKECINKSHYRGTNDLYLKILNNHTFTHRIGFILDKLEM